MTARLLSKTLWPMSGVDLFRDYLVSSLDFDGADGSRVFTDSAGVVWTAGSSSPTIVDSGATLHRQRASFTGGAGSYLVTPAAPRFNFGSGDFTIEFWFRTTQSTGDITLFAISWDGAPYTGGFTIQMNHASGSLAFWVTSFSTSGPFLTASPMVLDGQWHHFALVRRADVLTMYVDGNSVASKVMTFAVGVSEPPKQVMLGNDPTFNPSARGFVGLMDDFRVYKGAAKYTGPFTPE